MTQWFRDFLFFFAILAGLVFAVLLAFYLAKLGFAALGVLIILALGAAAMATVK